MGLLTRRDLLHALAAAPLAPALAGRAAAQPAANPDVQYGGTTLPRGIRSRLVPNVNGITMHVLEAGAEPGNSAVLLIHGFPELAYSWRHVMLPLVEAGYHVIAPISAATGGVAAPTSATTPTSRRSPR